ncbi:hypothetical protein [Flavobacterium sp.]|uniref:hypothetical protein n=1 Tax=Flavobacterium sp. TaxID=239 RepID=UPI002B4AE874|nr:hypothetical protein [Flavobacterium sp.]HLF52385.1 hypothetical protein [Flavobacterium sp.]
MKKAALFLGILSIMTIVSCKKKEETIPPPPPPTIETPAPPAEPVSEDGTSIKVSTDGLDVSTKDGATKTDVNVSNGDASVEIKK